MILVVNIMHTVLHQNSVRGSIFLPVLVQWELQ